MMEPERNGLDPGGVPDALAVQNSPEFAALRNALRRFVFPATIGFLTWYALYVLLSTYAKGMMAIEIVGRINVGLVLGVLQFVSTFGLAWAYSRYAATNLDPKAEAIKEAIENPAPPAPYIAPRPLKDWWS